MGKFKITQSPASKDIYLYPESNGCVNDCFPIGDIPNYKCVDDEYNALEPETTYVFMDGASTVSELYTMENHGTITGTINYVKVCDKAKSDKYPPHINADYKVMISNNGVCSYYARSGSMPLCTGYGSFEYAWLENPWTTTDWTWDDIDNLQAGFECSSPSVVMSPFPIIPTDDGDRTDITSVTTGYEHWEAVAQDKPYAEVFEAGAAWKYDLYKYIKAASYGTQTRGILYHNGYVFSACLGDGVYVHKWNGEQLEYVTNQDDGGLAEGWATDGTYYYLANATEIIAYTFDGESLTLKARANTTNNTTIHIIYKDGYIYLGDASNIEAWSFNGATFTEIDTASVGAAVEGIYHDGTYLYVTTSGGKIFAFSFDGTNLTELDQDQQALDRGENFERVSGDGTYIYACAVMDGVYAYSFDGTTLTYITRKDDGGSYYGVEAYGDYIFCTVEAAQDQLRAYAFDGVAFTVVGTNFNMPGGHIMWDIMANADGYLFTTYPNAEMYVFSGSAFVKIADVEEDNTPKYLDDNIVSVTVVAKMGKDPSAADGADIRGCFNIKTGGAEFNTSTDYYTLESIQRYYAHTWTTNPNTLAAWTLAEVQALQAGVGLYGTGTKYATCSRCYIVIGASTVAYPEIHTCRTYMKVNYSPDASVCTLPKPQEISTNHARNVKMINFWNGDREVYDVNRSGKSMVLTGSMTDGNPDVTDACAQIMCVRDMTRNGAVVTISGLNPIYFNGDYRINSFGWNKISEKPENYDWILELEAAN